MKAIITYQPFKDVFTFETNLPIVFKSVWELPKLALYEDEEQELNTYIEGTDIDVKDILSIDIK